MSKIEWNQRDTDKLVEMILGSERRGTRKGLAIYFIPRDANVFDDLGRRRYGFISLTPATDIRHALMLTNTKWFKDRFVKAILNYDVDAPPENKYVFTIRFRSGGGFESGWGETPELAICNCLLKLVEV